MVVIWPHSSPLLKIRRLLNIGASCARRHLKMLLYLETSPDGPIQELTMIRRRTDNDIRRHLI